MKTPDLSAFAKFSLAVTSALLVCAAHSGPWQFVPTPSPGTLTNTLYDISGSSATNLWAVGSHSSAANQGQMLIVRWDGSGWSLVSPPDAGQFGTRPSVEAVSVGNDGAAWIAGETDSVGTTGNRKTWVARRSGNGWSHLSVPELRPSAVYPYQTRSGFVRGMLTLHDDNVWVFGVAGGFGDGHATSVSMALHWDGTNWMDTEVPNPGNRSNYLTSGTATSWDNLYAAGYYRNIAGIHTAHVMRWNGSQWSQEDIPVNPGMGETFLFDIEALAPNDIWAVGQKGTGALILHYDGASWNLVESPLNVPVRMSALASISPNNIWAVSALTNRMFHYDGVSWSQKEFATIPGAASAVRVAMFSSPAVGTWMVGNWNHGERILTLAERLLSGAPSNAYAFRGIVVSGNIESLCYSDDDWLVLRPGLTLSSQEDPVQLIVEHTAAASTPGLVTLQIESHVSVQNIRRRIHMYNFNTNAYELVDDRIESTSDNLTQVTLNDNPGRFVEPGTNLMRARIAWRQNGPILAFPWVARTNLVNWSFSK